MHHFRKKFSKQPRRPAPPENTTHQITDVSADRDSEGANHGGGSQIVTGDRGAGYQQFPASNPPILTPGRGDGNATLWGERHTHMNSTEAQSEQFGRSAPDLRPAQRDSKIHNRTEPGDWRSGVWQHSETAPERALGGGQDGREARGLAQSGRYRVEGRGRDDRTLGHAALVVDLAEGEVGTFSPLKAVSKSISTLYARYQNTTAVKGKIEILRSRIATLEKLFEEPAGDEKETKLREGLSIKLEDLEEQLRSLREESAILQLVDNTQDTEDVSGLLEDLQEAINDYMMVQQMAIYDRGCRLMDAVQMAVLNSFRSARGAEFRHGERKGCMKGTRGAVLNAIELWAKDFNRSPIYWLNGLAGTGKSTIAKTTAERLFADGQLGASFFCSRDFEDRRNLHLIFPTLATQLARKYPEFRSVLVPLIQSDPNIAYESLYNQMEKLILYPLSETGISTVIVIDALDECEDVESASAILSVLGRLASEIPKVKFLLTGRPEPRITEGFRLPLVVKITDRFVLHGVEPDQVNNDIRLFFKNGFSELARRRRGLDDWPTEQELDRLCEQAGGLFVYAAATIKFIDNNKRDPKKQLKNVLWSQKVGGHEGKTLDSLYISILHEAFSGNDPEYDAKTRSFLSVAVLATNPLSPSAIATLLRVDPEDVPLILSSVNSLLILQDDTNYPVRPFHKSFPDFITDPTRCTNQRFYISPPDHHLNLLICCLGIMNRTLEKNMCRLPDAVANSDVSDLKERVDKYIDPALQYACVSWHVHLVNAKVIPAHAPTITSALRQFLTKKFLFWLEVLSVLGAVRSAAEALQVTTDWLEELPTLNVANDCFRFVTGYFEVIKASAPHIYHSALVLAPKKSIVRELYLSHANPFVRVVYGLPTSWDPNAVAATCPSHINLAVWSPCDRFIAISYHGTTTMDILDSVTLQRHQTLKSPQGVDMSYGVFIFSPDSQMLTCSNLFGRELSVISWDLQTGGVASVIKWKKPRSAMEGSPSITYSANGKMVGVACLSHTGSDIFICDVASGVYMHSHSISSGIPLSTIWTHKESLRFATTDATTTTIWEVGFTSGATPTEVETLPAPNCFHDHTNLPVIFLPTPCRLAFVDSARVLIWNTQNFKCLLHCTDARFEERMSFSSNGHYFACSTTKSEIYLWRESPTGYILCEILASSASDPQPLLSQNGESIAVLGGNLIKLWHTKSFTNSPYEILTQAPQCTEEFVLDFSPDGTMAVAAMQKDRTVMVLNLESGVPQLTINTSMEVYGLRVIGDTVVVIGDQKAITWGLPTGDCVPGVRVGPNDSSQIINLKPDEDDNVTGASISPDSCYIALTTKGCLSKSLNIYSTSTGECLSFMLIRGGTPWFTPDGHSVWCASDSGEVEVKVVGGYQLGTVDVEHPPEGYPWASSCGYKVTDDHWVLGPGGKQLLMLPPHWQSNRVQQVWKGQFLALLHGGLSEPIILELKLIHDL